MSTNHVDETPIRPAPTTLLFHDGGMEHLVCGFAATPFVDYRYRFGERCRFVIRNGSFVCQGIGTVVGQGNNGVPLMGISWIVQLEESDAAYVLLDGMRTMLIPSMTMTPLLNL
jgi:hypothetical protein